MHLNIQKIILNFAAKSFDYEEIEGLRDCVRAYVKNKEHSISKEIASLDPKNYDDQFDLEGYRYHLEAGYDFLGEVETLADELCVLALYKKIELAQTKLLQSFYPNLSTSQLHKVGYLKKNSF
jgi:hypothetical protein